MCPETKKERKMFESLCVKDNVFFLFIIDKRKVIMSSFRGGVVVRLSGASVVDVFDKLERLLVPVDQRQGVVFRMDCQQQGLKDLKNYGNSERQE